MRIKLFIWIMSCILLASSVFAAADLIVNNSGYYSFDDTTVSGGKFDDLTGNVQGKISGSIKTGVNGIYEQAFQYGGGSTEAILGDYNINGDWTVNFWYNNTEGIPSINRHFYVHQGGGDRSTIWIAKTTGYLNADQWGSGGGSTVTVSSTTTAGSGWHMITLVRNGSNWYLYKDAVQIGSQSGSIGTSNPTGNFTIDDFNAFKGGIDEVSIWAQDLDLPAIQELYNSGAPTSLQQYPYSAPSTTNFSITVTDQWSTSALTSVNATILSQNGSTYFFENTTGNKLFTNISSTAPFLHNITIESSSYFNKSYDDVNVSSNLAGSLYQALIEFNASEIITGNTIAPSNYTINSTTYQDLTSFYIKAGTYNVTFQATGYYSATQEVTISALTNTTYTFENMSGTALNVSAYDPYTSTQLENFTVRVYNDTYGYDVTIDVVGNETQFLLANIGYNITVNKTNYLTADTYMLLSGGYNKYNAPLYPLTTIFAEFYNEQTRLQETNVTWQIIGSTVGYNGTSATGQIFIENLIPDLYEIRYEKTGYNPRSYFLNIPIEQLIDANISLYLLDTTNGSSFTLTVTDKNNQPVSDLYASLLRRYVVNNQTTYEVVEMMQPAYALGGETLFYGVPDTTSYLFRVQNSSFDVLFQGAGTAGNTETLFLISSNIYIKVNTQQSPFLSSQNIRGLSVNLTNTTTAFWLSYVDANSITSQVCLDVYVNQTSLLSSQCSSLSSNIINYAYTPKNGSYYTAYVVATASNDNTEYIQDIRIMDYRNNDTGFDLFGILGVFFVIVNVLFFAFAFSDQPMISVLMSILAILLFSSSFVGLIKLNIILQGTLLVIGIIFAIVMRD